MLDSGSQNCSGRKRIGRQADGATTRVQLVASDRRFSDAFGATCGYSTRADLRRNSDGDAGSDPKRATLAYWSSPHLWRYRGILQIHINHAARGARCCWAALGLLLAGDAGTACRILTFWNACRLLRVATIVRLRLDIVGLTGMLAIACATDEQGGGDKQHGNYETTARCHTCKHRHAGRATLGGGAVFL
jgi:hypothetical protein